MITVSFIDQLDQPSIRDREVKARWIKMQQSLSLYWEIFWDFPKQSEGHLNVNIHFQIFSSGHERDSETKNNN